MKVTEAQLAAISFPAPALQVLACAGSGKTEVLARRAVRYLLEGTPPIAVVAFTFTNRAAAELRERIDRRAAESDARFGVLPPVAAGMFVGTIHAYCLQLLQEHGGVYEMYDPLSEEREWAVLCRFARRAGIVDLLTSTWPGQPASVRKAVKVFRDSLAVVYNDAIPVAVLEERAPQFASVVARYERLLAGMQLLSFDQMIHGALRELAPGGRIRKTLEGRIREVLVDEYQDLNPAQERLLQRLEEIGARLTVVGDDDQAIYQWRGGDVSLSLSFPERYAGSHRLVLAENHRSVAPIVSLASQFASTIGGRVDKSMIPVRADAGPAVEMLTGGSPEEEAACLVERIKTLLAGGHRPGDIAVLCRSVRSSARPLVQALRREGIPFALVGRLSLLDSPEMALVARVFVFWGGGTWKPDEEQEVITLARLAVDIAELTGAGETEAARIAAELEHMGHDLANKGVRDLVEVYLKMLQVIGLPTEGPDRRRQEGALGRFSELLTEFEHAQRRAAVPEPSEKITPSTAQELTEDMTILGEAFPGALPPTPLAHLEISPGAAFLGRLRFFLEEFASQAAEEGTEGLAPEYDAVNIMTVHQAKGLEFPVVFVPALVDRRFPSARMGEERLWYVPADLFDKERYQGREEDERRLFYVAMTRARELLVLSWFTRYRNGGARPSRFLEDLARLEARKEVRPAGQCRPLAAARGREGEPIVEVAFSQLLTFSECPRKYYLRHVCGFQPPIAPEMGFGKLLHHVIAELARRARDGAPATVHGLDEILAESFYLPFAGRTVRELFYKAARRRLGNYVRHHGAELVRTLEAERRFEVPLGSARARGRIDLLLQVDGPGDVELIDFKTAANRPPSAQHRNQLRLYAEAARTLGMNPVRLVIHDLDAEAGERIVVAEDQSELAVFRATLRQWIDDIRTHRFPPAQSDETCPACDFSRLCGTGDQKRSPGRFPR